MTTNQALKDTPPFAGHSPDQERPLGGYAALSGVFTALCVGFAAWLRASERELPDRMDPRDLALVSVATYKSSRLIAKSRVTSSLRAPFTTFQDDAGAGEVDEAARGKGLRRAIGELLVCPYCLGIWTATGFSAALVVFPRPTRLIASVLSAASGADLLQIAYGKAEDTL